MNTGRRLRFDTAEPTEFIDITARLQAEVTGAGLRNGRLHIHSLHTTFAITINENEPLLLEDFRSMLDRLVPRGSTFQHDDFSRRVGITDQEPVNGHAHCRQVLMQPSHTALVEDGRLVLGRWQSIFAVELDGPRHREMAIQMDGDFERPARGIDADLVELELARQLLVDPEAVGAPMRRLVEAGGKRLRPLLVQLTARLGEAHDPLRTASLAAAIELIHCATLVHDDYVDESAERRGRPTVAAQEGPARAVAVGDYHFAKATRLIAELGEPAVTRTVAEAMDAICLSQLDDLNLRGSYPGDPGDYMKVVRGKTAALFSAACVSGAQLSHAEPEVIGRLGRYGELLGIAFQMADDLVDFQAGSGKPLGQDIRERVVSLPLIYASEHSKVGSELRRLLAGRPDEEDIPRVLDLVRASGAIDRVGAEARDMARMAAAELDEVELDGVKSTLVELARSAADRIS